MKYLTVKYASFDENFWSVITTEDDEVFTSFSAEVGNPNYDAFLTQAELTDKQVHALKTDVWYDFPNG
jgi:hypothetical protein